VSPAPAAGLLAAAAAAALLAEHTLSVAALVVALLAVCLRAPAGRRWPYLAGSLSAAAMVFLVSPLVQHLGTHIVWAGPQLPVFGTLDVTGEELEVALFQGLRFAAVALAFAAYALLLDHDRLIQAAGFARRSVLGVGLATRLVPTLERDARGLVEALRGRRVPVHGLRGRSRLLTPLVAGSLERGLNLAEAMEARGYGRAERTRMPRSPWSRLDRVAVAVAPAVIAIGALWL
jgi:energy-coupling factor transport system permease protein